MEMSYNTLLSQSYDSHPITTVSVAIQEELID